MLTRRCLTVLAAGLVLLSTGCYAQETDGPATVVHYEPWVAPVAVLVVGLVVAFSVWRFRRGHRYEIIFGIGAVVLGVLLVPTVVEDFARVDDDHFEGRYGLWWNPTQFNVAFDEVAAMSVRTERKGGRRRSTSYYLDCQMKDGSVRTVSLGDLNRELFPELVKRVRGRGIVLLNDSAVPR